MPSMRYDPSVFVCPDVATARARILSPEVGLSTDERWERETAWLAHELVFPAGLVIDYGCGVGRLAKVIRTNAILGVDVSTSMLCHALAELDRPTFGVVHPPMLQALVRHGLRAQGALAVWVLQHCVFPVTDIRQIADALEPGAPFYVVNRTRRYVPVTRGDGGWDWGDDGKDILKLLAERFDVSKVEPMPADLCDPEAYLATCWRR